LWTETHDCLGNNDKGYSVDVDTMGNVYITGSEQANFVYPDIIVRKYDGEGNTLWTTTFGDPDGGIDIGYGIAVDSMNNVFVAGDMDNIENNGWDKDILLLKYSQIVPPIADFIFDIDDPLDTVLLPGQSIYFTDLSQNMGTVDDEWLWEIIDATDHSTVVASSTLQNPVFTWEDLAYFFAAPSAEHWYDVQLTATNSEASDSITREFQFMSIPEPSTLLLLAPALLGFAGLLRRKLR